VVEAIAMGSLLDELARREAAVRQRIEEFGERIAELNGLLEAEEDRLARLVITRETVEEILGEAAQVGEEPAAGARSLEPAETAEAASRLGVVTVPRSKLKRLVERGWATEDGPGLFMLVQPVARHLGVQADPAGWGGGTGRHPCTCRKSHPSRSGSMPVLVY
jgi:hypothetical protein